MPATDLYTSDFHVFTDNTDKGVFQIPRTAITMDDIMCHIGAWVEAHGFKGRLWFVLPDGGKLRVRLARHRRPR